MDATRALNQAHCTVSNMEAVESAQWKDARRLREARLTSVQLMEAVQGAAQPTATKQRLVDTSIVGHITPPYTVQSPLQKC